MTNGEQEADGPSDFVEEMYVAVVETAWLWEVPLGATDVGPGEVRTVHGPWEPTDCSRQLLTWFHAGLITLYAEPPDEHPRPRAPEEWQRWNSGELDQVLDPREARRVLAAPERWTRDSEEGYLRLWRTDRGMDPTASW